MRRLVPLAVLSIALAGCTGLESEAKEASQKYQDADDRFAQGFEGGVHEEESMEVPVGTTRLRVAAAYAVEGGAHFYLYDPMDRTVKSESFAGEKSDQTSSWYATTNPTPGTWRLSVSAAGQGGYAFGFYY